MKIIISILRVIEAFPLEENISDFITNYMSNSIYDSVLQGKGNDSKDVGELSGEYYNTKPVDVKEDNTNNRWGSEVTVEEGKEYLVRLYVHNDNPKGLNAIARDTTLHFTFPLEKGKNLALQGSIDSSSANPKRYKGWL